MSMKHAPLPWRLDWNQKNDGQALILDDEGYSIAHLQMMRGINPTARTNADKIGCNTDKINAQLMVTAVNNYCRLLEKVRQSTNQLAKIRDAEGCPPGHCHYQSKATMSEIAGHILDEFESLLAEISAEESGEGRKAS